MRDSMKRFYARRARKASPVVRPSSYTDSDGVVHQVGGAYLSPIVGLTFIDHVPVSVYHRGARGDACSGCWCAECRSAPFTPSERIEGAREVAAALVRRNARVEASKAVKLAAADDEAWRRMQASAGVGTRTIRRRK